MSGVRENERQVVESVPPARRWRFGSAVLDERSLTLSVNGDAIEIERKPLEVLLHLLHHAGEVVTKDELIASVWPGRILSDSTMTSCLYKLREALRDDDQTIVKTVHGYGYRLVAAVTVEQVETAPPPRFEFKPGEHLPMRPLWSLVERLGTGGHGEAWLAKHDKTHERRVYKFAADSGALVSLKREITIYRLLHDSLGDRPDLVHLVDWNLEDPPYFVEYAYQEAGSLSTWAKAQGGIDRIPMEVRLDIAAQVADALAAAHSVGVLHKDLKPSNVLIGLTPGNGVQAKLCDFGSGGVLDLHRLEQMGITRLGFTRTIAALTHTSGTPLYLAPEVITGQPFTVKADIYALGVMLYQIVAGNFHKPLAPGWEQDVPDELLREDIAISAEGHHEARLADAARLAQRLRTLDERRRQREAEKAEQVAADLARLEIERMRARRTWVRLALAVLVVGVAASSVLYVDARRARDRAAAAAETEHAVNDFLSKDMFAQISSDRPLRSLTVKDLVDQAAAQVDKRFADKPAAAARLHVSLGAAYVALDDAAAAETALDSAFALARQHEDPGSDNALAAVEHLLIVKYVTGKLAGTLPDYESVLAAGVERLGPVHPRVVQVRQQLAYMRFYLGQQRLAATELRALAADAAAAPKPDEAFLADTGIKLGEVLTYLAEYADAEAALRDALERHRRRLGEDHLSVATARLYLAGVQTSLGRYDEADAGLSAALAAARQWTPSDAAGFVLQVRLRQGRLWMEQGRLAEAAAVLEKARDTYASWKGPELDQSYGARYPLAELYQRQGRLAEAEVEMREALRGAERLFGPADIDVQRFRIALANILRDRGRLPQAREALRQVRTEAMAQLPPRHPFLAEWRRAEGLLWLQEHDFRRAREALGETLSIYEERLGARHWRTERAGAELAQVPDTVDGG